MTEPVVHPFVRTYRRGTTERITSLDPMSQAFLDSVNVPSKYTTTTTQGMKQLPGEYTNSILQVPLSRLSKQIHRIGEVRSLALGALGRPWDKNGYLTSPFNINSAVILDPVPDGADGYARTKLIMDFWSRREPEFQSEKKLNGWPIRVTLINKFDAVPYNLHCYSFLVEGSTSAGVYTPDFSVVNIWINRVYSNEGRQTLPMYFAGGGSLTLGINLIVAGLGLSIDPCGRVFLRVNFEDSVWERELDFNQITWLRTVQVLPPDGCTPGHLTAHMANANLAGIGYTLGAGGRLWQSPKVVEGESKNWQLKMLTEFSVLSLNRGQNNSIDYAGVSKKREQHPEREMSIVAGVVARNVWRAALESNSCLAPIVQALKTEVNSRSIVKQAREVDPGLSATELVRLFQSKSMELGRFNFEANLPVLTSTKPPAQAKATEN